MGAKGSDLLGRLREEVVLWDGGMGTALQDRGLPVGQPPEQWNLERPEEVRSVHREFYEAGSDLVQTNTFGANRLRLAVHGLEGRIEETNRAAAEIALSVCPEGRFVVGDLGPTGALKGEPGNREPDAAQIEEIEEAYAEQGRFLEAAGVHLLHVETQSGMAEAMAALRGARQGSSLPVIVSITLRREGAGFCTLGGDDPADVWRSLADGGVDAVGANCMLRGPDLLDAVRCFRTEVSIPFVAQPAAPKGARGESDLPYILVDIARAGANGVGGCCGVTAEIIARAASGLEEARLRS